jgi:hypothetical protein
MIPWGGDVMRRIAWFMLALVAFAGLAMMPARADDADALLRRAYGFEAKGDHGRAANDIIAAIRLFPKQADAILIRAYGEQAKVDHARATADIIAAIVLLPRDQPRPELVQPVAAPPNVIPAPPVRPVAPPVVVGTGVRVALVIGNGRYTQVPQLPNPPNDAADIAQALRKLGFDVIEGRDVDRKTMEDKIREFGRKLDKADLALFFYAGHGLQVAGKNYLVPIDAKLERPGDLTFETIDMAVVLEQMESAQRVDLIFLDACRDNPFAKSLARSLGTRSASVGQGLAQVQSAVGTMIIYSTQPDNVAQDGAGRNSPFTSALLKHMATPGLEIDSMMKRVRADVLAATQQQQVPWDHSSLVGDVFLAQ